ncbi:hypothetical protein Q4567_21895 [Aliiglaciecola sp. 2_MG-2023]|uniref:hypothetical protein n=1 Tax=unclassified Aliiglaciecola TaxID=2593648 RepID=UPI0026E2EAA4|nr:MULTISPECIES: hypothetical protein [unclassified Aliiglaciecola]MDO6713392.1 hypothetical protein [Aliiglaciecola sp. 2_MG-2023]MDO6754513.1 hypothetical protein [Aliiglaciecola sp. 1_MG-2023]
MVVLIYLFLFSSEAKSDYDPCSLDIYPIIEKRDIEHSLSVEHPAVFLPNENSRVYLSVSDLIEFSTSNPNPYIPYLDETIEYFTSSLKGISEPTKNIGFLQSDLSSLEGKEQQIAVNVYGFIINGFQAGLLNSKAMVTINGDVVTSSTFTLQKGEEPNPIDEYNKVHKIKFISNGTLIYDSCWMDK